MRGVWLHLVTLSLPHIYKLRRLDHANFTTTAIAGYCRYSQRCSGASQQLYAAQANGKRSRLGMQLHGSVVTNTHTYRVNLCLTTAKSYWTPWILCMIYIRPCMQLHETANKKQPMQNQLWMKSILACRMSCMRSVIF